MKNHRKGSKNWKFPVVDLRKFHSNTLFRAIFPEMKICQKYLFTSTSVFDGNTNILVGLFSRPKYSWNILKFHVQNGLSNSWKLALQSNQCFGGMMVSSCHANIQHAKIFPKKQFFRKIPPKNWKFSNLARFRDLELDRTQIRDFRDFISKSICHTRFHLENDLLILGQEYQSIFISKMTSHTWRRFAKQIDHESFAKQTRQLFEFNLAWNRYNRPKN